MSGKNRLCDEGMRGFVARREIDSFALSKFGSVVEEESREALKRYVQDKVHFDCLDCKLNDTIEEEYSVPHISSKRLEVRMRCKSGSICMKEHDREMDRKPLWPVVSKLHAELDRGTREDLLKMHFPTFEATSIKEYSPGSETRERFEAATSAIKSGADVRASLEEMKRSLDVAGLNSDHAADSMRMYGLDKDTVIKVMEESQPGYIPDTKDRPNVNTEGFGDW